MNAHTRRLFASLLASLALCLSVAAVRSQHDAVRSQDDDAVRLQNDAVRRVTVTPEHVLNLNPSISGDGRRVVFESTADITGAGGGAGFHTLRADVSDQAASFTRVAASRAPSPAVSRDGSRLAFASRENLTGENPDGNSEIFLFADETVRTCWQHLPTSPYNP